MPKCDVVLVGLKTVNEHLLPELLGPLLKKNTLVVLIQNGLGVEADVQKMLPDQPLAAGLAFICASKTSPGVVDHQDYGSINIGNYSCKSKRKMSMLIRDFKSAGIKVGEVEYNEARWKKAVWNLPFNGLSVVLDTPTDRLLTEKATRALVYDLMMEVIGAAQACGVETLTSDFADQMMAMTESMSPYLPSMKLDYDHHRPMEIYYLYTHPIEIARQAGFDMPKLAMLEAELKFREQSYEWKRY
jgi:2-dehydropantoate 2-reductase